VVEELEIHMKWKGVAEEEEELEIHMKWKVVVVEDQEN